MNRVLHVLTTTQRRGAEVFASELAPALDELGWSSSLVALAPSGPDGLNVEALGGRRRSMRTLSALRSRMSAASVVIAHGSTTLPACVLAGSGLRVPLVYRSVGDPRYWAPTPAKRLRTAVLMRRPARVVALTGQAADALEGHYKVPLERLVVIPKGVDTARLPERTTCRALEARRTLGLPEDAIIALYLGALSPEKNVSLAIEAASMVEGLLLVVGGAGQERAALEEMGQRLGAGRVRFLGQVADPSLPLTAANVLVLPSHTEGMPGVAMEAGTAGIPVVATDVGWVRDIVLDKRTGVLVPPGDATAFADGIRCALRDAVTLGAEARTHCLEHFDISRIATAWSVMLAALCDR